MNDYDVEEVAKTLDPDTHPNLAAGAQTLLSLMRWVNSHSDGWHIWQPPRRAATKLMAIVERADRFSAAAGDYDASDCTLADLKAAYTPLKTFRTKADQGQWSSASGPRPGWCDFKVIDPAEAAAQRIEDAKDAVGTHVRYTILLERPLGDEQYHRHGGGVGGVGLARFLQHELAECGLPGEIAVVGRRIEGRARFPLSEMGPGSEPNAANFQDNQ